MTVLSQTPYTRAVGNGVTTVFPFTFKLLNESDLVVSVDGVAIPATAYSVSGIGENAGGDVTFLVAPANSADVFFERVIPFERVDDYQYSGDLKAEVLNPDFDRLWMAVQQIQSLFDRSIHFPAIESGIDSELPALSDRENNLLGFDENGNLVAVAPAAQSATALQALLAQSSGSSLVGFIHSGTGAVARTVQEKLRDKVSIYDFGIVGDGIANDSTAINNALSSGAKEIDGLGLTCKANTSVTIPSGVTLRNIKLQAGTAGMNVLLFSSYSRVENVKIVGTGTVSVVERGIYPAHDGVTSAYLDVEISNLTAAVHLQPLSSVAPYLNEIHAYVHDIVGTTGASEGYGVLLSPANDNQVFIRAKNIKRHALYLSAGASRNQCFVNVDTCYHHAVSIYATSAQPSCADNTVHIKASNLQNAPAQTGLSAAVGITQKADRNRIYVDCVSSGLTDHAVRIDGVGNISGPWPTNNIIYATAKGTFLGDSVLYSGDADNTVFIDPIIEGKSTAALIKFYDSGANLYAPKRSGAVHGGSLDGIDSTMNGVSNSAARGAVDVSGGIIFSRCFANVVDYTSTRIGVNKTYTKTVTFTNVANNSSGNTTITLPESFSNIAVHAQVTSASTPGDGLEAVISAYTSTSVTVYGYNRSGGLQAVISVTVFVSGD